jgi:hypothetical protein
LAEESRIRSKRHVHHVPSADVRGDESPTWLDRQGASTTFLAFLKPMRPPKFQPSARRPGRARGPCQSRTVLGAERARGVADA